MTNALVLVGAFFHESGIESLAPSQVKACGIVPPLTAAELVRANDPDVTAGVVVVGVVGVVGVVTVVVLLDPLPPLPPPSPHLANNSPAQITNGTRARLNVPHLAKDARSSEPNVRGSDH
ncbi:MAG: hypothetical protein NTX21_01185 [Alphaproteobacteria bacterium]|nr:hypothetical protein [Alphaproteobacteria bacterium]